MTNAKHTPGPWKVTEGYQCKIIDADGIDRVCTVNGGNNGNIQAANARLIAAAPDGYNAAILAIESASPVNAKETDSWESGIIIDAAAYNALRAFIAKAEGN